MSPEGMKILSYVALGIFVLWIVLKVRLTLPPRDPSRREPYERWRAVTKRARLARHEPKVRAAALREAAMIALEGLDRPEVAAAQARRADALDPDEPTSIATLVRAMTAAERYAALERQLWLELAKAGSGSARETALLDALIGLYRDGLHRPERADVLERLRAR